MQVFFEDLALPHLVRTQLAETPEWKSHRAGFTSDGTPTNLHVRALDARRHRPAHRHRRRRRGASCASSRTNSKPCCATRRSATPHRGCRSPS